MFKLPLTLGSPELSVVNQIADVRQGAAVDCVRGGQCEWVSLGHFAQVRSLASQ